MLVQIAVGLHAEELRGQVLAVLGVPARHAHQRGVLGEGAAGVFVEAHRDADVVVAQPDSVGTDLGGARGGGARVEDVGERDPRQANHADDRVRIRHGPTAARGGADVTPLDAGVGDGDVDRVDAHRKSTLALEPAERVDADADDGHFVHG